VFTVTDTGTGFAPEALKHATEQFYMDDDSRNSKSHFGMGLFIAASVVRQHKGKLSLGNARETGGARVILEIPVKTCCSAC